jgi:hypothetical protein
MKYCTISVVNVPQAFLMTRFPSPSAQHKHFYSPSNEVSNQIKITISARVEK